MTKVEFMVALEGALAGFPAKNREETLAYYSEMLADRTDEGMTEEEAVLSMGPVEEIRDQLLRELPVRKLVREKIPSRKSAGKAKTILLILGFPLWFPLLCTAAALILALYITFWAVLLALWATDLAIAAGGVLCAMNAIWQFNAAAVWVAIFMLGGALFLLALSVVLFFVFRWLTGKILRLGKKILLAVKKMFVKGGKNP